MTARDGEFPQPQSFRQGLRKSGDRFLAIKANEFLKSGEQGGVREARPFNASQNGFRKGFGDEAERSPPLFGCGAVVKTRRMIVSHSHEDSARTDCVRPMI